MNFRKKYKSLLKKKKKVATLRMGIKEYEKDEMVKVVAGGEEIGIARVLDVRILRWNDIDKNDVRMEGLKRKRDLEKELKKIYGEFDDDTIFTQIVFEIVEESKCSKNRKK